jgi:small multidrug resistance pump
MYIPRMPYVLLAAAIAAEVAGTTALKYSYGFSKFWPSLVTVIGYVISFVLLAQALKSMSVGTAYAIWSAVGTAAVATIGMIFMGEQASAAKLAGLVLVIAGVLLLHLAGGH